MIDILLTGANGSVGSYFKDNYYDKYNISTFSFLHDNLKNLNLSNINIIIHLSALVHQMGAVNTDQYKKVNLTQTLDLAKKAKENGVKHFIFISTISVYGIEVGTINENSICKPITDYGRSKYEAELALQQLEDNDFKISIIRPPIVNGYNAPGNMKSLINLVSKIPLLPFANIQNKRSMIYIGNLCHFIDVICEQQKSGVFLVSDKKSISTTKLIELIAKAQDKKTYLVQIPFFEALLKLIKPSFYKRLYESLEIENSLTMKTLFGDAEASLPFSIEDGITLMIKGEDK